LSWLKKDASGTENGAFPGRPKAEIEALGAEKGARFVVLDAGEAADRPCLVAVSSFRRNPTGLVSLSVD
jgi:hypothetical protein